MRTSSRSTSGLLALLLTLAFALGGLGCTEAERARAKSRSDKFKKQQAERMLKDRVEEYWDFARWYAWSETARFLEKSEDQKSHLDQGTEGDPNLLPKMDAIEILYIYVDPETRKTGEVKVRWKEIATRSTEVEEKQAEQRWYRRGGQWWLAPESGIPDDPYDDLGDEDRAAEAEPIPELETVEAPATADR